MDPLVVPYAPGYRDAFHAWATYVTRLKRRPAAWMATFVALDVVMLWLQPVTTTVVLFTIALVAVILVSLVPLAFRLVWARQIAKLNIRELEVGESGLVLSGPAFRLDAPWSLYEGFLETARYFFLTRSNGLFSFVPVRGWPDEMRRSLRGALEARLPEVEGLTTTSTTRLAPRMPVWLYASTHVLLVVWLVIEGLRLGTLSLWAPLGGMFVLDRFLTRDSLTQYLLAGFIMLALLVYGAIQVSTPPERYGELQYRVYEVVAFLVALGAHQAVLWRLVLKTPGVEE